jgi:hypothetical protein
MTVAPPGIGVAVAAILVCACLLGCPSGDGSKASPPMPEGSPQPVQTVATAAGSPPNALGLPSASVAAVVNPMNLPAYAGPTGSVEGIVLVRGPDPPDVPNLDVHSCPAALDTYGKLFRAGPRRADGTRPLADALVLVTGYAGSYLPEKDEIVRVTIGAGCGYPSRAIALTFGQRLDVANDSAVPFAPYIEGASQMPVLIAPPKQQGPPVKIFLPRADYFPLRDQLQKFVRGDVYVLRHPLHAVTDTQGHFRINGVPTGKLTVSARLAALLGEAVKDVEVRDGAGENVELVLNYAGR